MVCEMDFPQAYISCELNIYMDNLCELAGVILPLIADPCDTD